MDFKTRKIILIGNAQRDMALSVIRNLPTSIENPLEVIIRVAQKARKQSQNELMWAGALHDIAEQAWVEGRQFSAEVWHEHAKREFLPEDNDPDIENLAADGYRKWSILPNGERHLTGTTTKLKVKGMAQYIEKIHAFGAGLGVQFHASPSESER